MSALALGSAAITPALAQAPGFVDCVEQQIPVRDGTLLGADIYLPAGEGPHPVILHLSPYGFLLGHGCWNLDSNLMAFWAENGYVAIAVDSRGTFRSEGEFDPMFVEQLDGYDVIEWAASQEWSTGEVGMVGRSYYGATQWQTAIMAPPGLKAIAPHITSTDYFDHWTYQNGVFDQWFGQSWTTVAFAADVYRRQLIEMGTDPDDAWQMALDWRAMAGDLLLDEWATKDPAELPFFRTLAPYYYEWLENNAYNDYWHTIDIEDKYHRVEVPAYVTGGWRDSFQIGSVRSFLGLQEQGATDLARTGTKLFMDNNGHGGMGVFNYGEEHTHTYNDDIRAQQLRFFDHHIKGIDNGIDAEPAMRLFVALHPDEGTEGSGGFWVEGDTLPLPGTQPVRFYLGSDGAANTRDGGGYLSTEQGGGSPDTYEHDPANPVPQIGGFSCCSGSIGIGPPSGAQDQEPVETRQDVLVYTSAPLEEDMVVVGSLTAEFFASSSADETMFLVKVTNVQPDGTSVDLIDRPATSNLRQGSKAPLSPAEPGGIYRYTVELGYLGVALKQGHQLRVQIASSNSPRYPTFPEPATVTIYHDDSHPSFVELPVVRGISIPD